MADGARAVVGHCRLATSSKSTNLNDVQPVMAGNFAIAHNGNVYNAPEVLRRNGLQALTDNDSEALALLAMDHQGKTRCAPENAIAATLAQVETNGVYALLALDRERLCIVACRRRLPLAMLRRDEGVYFASWPGPTQLIKPFLNSSLKHLDENRLLTFYADAPFKTEVA